MEETQYEEKPLPDLLDPDICLWVNKPEDLISAVNYSIGKVRIKGAEYNLTKIKYVNGVNIKSPKELVEKIENEGLTYSAIKICKVCEDLGIELK